MVGNRHEVFTPGDEDGFSFDDSAFPYVHIALLPGEPTVSHVEALFRRYDGVFARYERHVLIVDLTRGTTVPSAAVRQRIKAFEDKTRSLSAAKNYGSAIVMSSALVRGAMTALRWISPPPAPNAYFGTVPDAANWCVSLLQKARVAVPPRLEMLAAPASAGARAR